jgi:hypothetical protein
VGVHSAVAKACSALLGNYTVGLEFSYHWYPARAKMSHATDCPVMWSSVAT